MASGRSPSPRLADASRPLRRIGHKGADLIRPGNTIESFEAGVAAGSDTIEIDVLWTPAGHPRLPAAERAPLVIAHDWHDARGRTTLTLDEALEAFTRPPLDSVELNLDIKLAGREDEIADAVRNHGLLERGMVSTMELESLEALRKLEPSLRRGWTYPRVTKDWTSKSWAAPAVLGSLAVMRRRLPGLARRGIPRLGAHALWVYHPLVSRRLAEATRAVGAELIAWTVDDSAGIERLIAMGVDGIVSNDPRLLPAA